MKLFKEYWKTLFAFDLAYRESVNFLIFTISYNTIYKAIIQTKEDQTRCLVTNGFRIYYFNEEQTSSLIKQWAEINNIKLEPMEIK